MNGLEEVIASSAQRVYDELTASLADRDIRADLQKDEKCAIVIFDGLSLREAPALLELAEKSSLRVVQRNVGLAALPSETLDFVDQRLGFGRVAPSLLPTRRELKQKGIAAYYYSQPGQKHTLDREAQRILLWSSFPDNTYSDSGARFAEHFAHIQAALESAWNSTVMALPRDRRVLVTSDHGYIFLGSGLGFFRDREVLRPLSTYLGGERFARISERGAPPKHDDLAIYQARDLAILKGRVPLHPPGPSASKLYKHGGLSLMEMLTPWIVLAP